MRRAVLLAAGSSRRWGHGNKLFDRYGGLTLLARALRTTRVIVPPRQLLVVTGWQHARIAAEVRRHARAATVVRAHDHHEGMGASLRAAATALRPRDREVAVLLGDMAAISPATWARMRRAPGATVRPAWRGCAGHPVLLRGDARARLAGARGDAGPARGGAATLVPADRRCLQNLDRPGQRRR